MKQQVLFCGDVYATLCMWMHRFKRVHIALGEGTVITNDVMKRTLITDTLACVPAWNHCNENQNNASDKKKTDYEEDMTIGADYASWLISVWLLNTTLNWRWSKRLMGNNSEEENGDFGINALI